MNAPTLTRHAGLFLVAWGVAFWVAADMASVTALIPAFFGAVFFVLGFLGKKEGLRMHVMHVAAVLALLGFGMGIWRLTKAPAGSLAFFGILGMAVVSGLLLFAYIRSFRAARKARAG